MLNSHARVGQSHAGATDDGILCRTREARMQPWDRSPPVHLLRSGMCLSGRSRKFGPVRTQRSAMLGQRCALLRRRCKLRSTSRARPTQRSHECGGDAKVAHRILLAGPWRCFKPLSASWGHFPGAFRDLSGPIQHVLLRTPLVTLCLLPGAAVLLAGMSSLGRLALPLSSKSIGGASSGIGRESAKLGRMFRSDAFPRRSVSNPARIIRSHLAA